MNERDNVLSLWQAIQKGGFQPQEPPEGYNSWSFFVKAEAEYVFFRLIDSTEDLQGAWSEAQNDVGRARDNWFGDGGYLPDLYLILVFRGGLDPEDGLVQAIRRDPYICHKVFVSWEPGMSPDLVLAALPFWPLRMPSETVGAVLPVSEALEPHGYSALWIRQLLQPALRYETIATALLDGTTSMRDPQPEDERKPGATTTQLRATGAPLWRIGRVSVEGFRGFPRRFDIDLNADLVVLYAPNGTGKTSLCEAIEWALTRQVKRVARPGHDAPKNAESPVLHVQSDRAEVELTLLRGTETRDIRISQTRGEPRAVWHVDGEAVATDKEGIRRALDARLPERPGAPWVRDAFRCYHFLEQDTLYRFLRESKPNERYEFYQILTQTVEYSLAEERAGEVAAHLDQKASSTGNEIRAVAEELIEKEQELASLQSEAQRALELAAGETLGQTVLSALKLADQLRMRPPGAGTSTDPTTLAELLAPSLAAELEVAEAMKMELEQLPGAHADAERRRKLLDAANQAVTGLSKDKAELEAARAEAEARVAKFQETLSTLQGDSNKLAERRTQLLRYRELRTRDEQVQRVADSLDARLARVRRLKQLTDAESMAGTWRRTEETIRDVRHRRQDLVEALGNLEPRLKAARVEAQRLELESHDVETQIAGLQSSLSQRKRLLVDLQAHVDSCHCPLCRHEFPSTEALQEAIKASIEVVPERLSVATKQLLDLNRAKEQARSGVEKLASDMGVVEENLRKIDVQIKQLDGTLAEAADQVTRTLGSVTLDSALWATVESEIALLTKESGDDAEEISRLAQDLRKLLLGGTDAEAASGSSPEPAACLVDAQQALVEFRLELDGLQLTEQERLAPASALESMALQAERLRSQQHDFKNQQNAAEGSGRELAERIVSVRFQEEAATSQVLEHNRVLDEYRSRLGRLGLGENTGLAGIATLQKDIFCKFEHLRDLRRAIDQLRVHARVLSASERVRQLMEAVGTLKVERDHLGTEEKRCTALANQCRSFISDVGVIRSNLEEERKALYLPTVSQLYQRLSVHPYFGDLELDVDPANGQLRVQVRHPQTGEPVGALVDYYSAAQLNIAALSMFLTQALLQGWSSLSTIILDDPVQHLDDINVHALLDLLRALANTGRQIIVTTCNRDLYKLMLLEFSPLNARAIATQRTPFRAYRLYGIGRKGPEKVEDKSIVEAIVRRQAAVPDMPGTQLSINDTSSPEQPN